MASAAETIVAVARRTLSERGAPVLVALDGPSGAGKSTLVGLVAAALHATIVPTDDFFAAAITAAEWEALGPPERAAAALDWRRLRREALEPLLAGVPARWRAFDFTGGVRADGTYAMRADLEERRPAPVILLEGAYAARPELSDLIHLAVMVDAPITLRHERLAAREEASFLEAWHARWDAAEAWYFARVRPPSSFDVVVSIAATTLRDA